MANPAAAASAAAHTSNTTETSGHDDCVPEATPGYHPPAHRSIGDILNKDSQDESLRKYKEKLLGAAAKEIPTPFPDDGRKVILKKLSLCVEGRQDIDLDLSGDMSQLRSKALALKEGTEYRVKLCFYVQRDIVTGLKLVQASYKAGIRIDKSDFMLGSFAPNLNMYEMRSEPEEAPSGLLSRGSYLIKSRLLDDDAHEYCAWEWTLEIRRDWEDSTE